MSNSKTILLILLVAASAIASLLIHQRARAAMLDRAALLQQQSRQLAALQAEQQNLSNIVARATSTPVANHSTELAKLRAEAETLRKQTNSLARRPKFHVAPRPASKPVTYTPKYWDQMRQAQGTKGIEAKDIATAMTQYAENHENQFPSSLDQITPYLAKNHVTLSGTNQFEIVYQGSLDQLDGIPWGSIALVRDTQTWLTPDGRPARVYGMANDSGQTVASDDNFQSWESEHVIPPASSSAH